MILITLKNYKSLPIKIGDILISKVSRDKYEIIDIYFIEKKRYLTIQNELKNITASFAEEHLLSFYWEEINAIK